MEFLIEPIKDTDDFSSFLCELNLDEFLKEDALWYEKNQLSKTYIVKLNSGKPVAYYTVVMDSVRSEHIDEINTKEIKLIPSYKIARLAVDTNHQGKDIGKTMLFDAIYHAKELSREIGCRLVIVDSKPDVTGFYERYGFKPISIFQSKNNPKYYLDLMTIE